MTNHRAGRAGCQSRVDFLVSWERNSYSFHIKKVEMEKIRCLEVMNLGLSDTDIKLLCEISKARWCLEGQSCLESLSGLHVVKDAADRGPGSKSRP